MAKEKIYTAPEKPLTSDELNERVYKMLRERAKQDAKFDAEQSPPPSPPRSEKQPAGTQKNNGASFRK